ncbi:TrbC/VirB2 family protein [Luteimonas fraxinea]|uniref:TrbC/VirB2 family protein n=1 Tax=Luteimonas fraxinea TaxID=2901869 RepID=A0ABS8UHZ0_9GAMM|nr:TrbC/VirB2 family protein [Luteimonas fraxinea]MCD9098110.1 TrbC/VirB2 family protein [Luteimonas fraxinea]MCD9125359.1 TrbC/VirB2 family protein [Luteimonas fraxinea]UHH09164.1 TrbC/VirB2 family protein [Luteimonas fraxinea]
MKKADSIISTARAARAAALAACASVATFPLIAMAQDVSGATSRVNSFFNNINALLNVASIAIVTIAVIFAGYQIAFNHKRIGDVAPVLIGGFLIGAAAQIAKMLLPADVTKTAMVVVQLLPVYA